MGFLSGAGGSITVEEVDGAPSVAGVTTIVVTNGTLTDDGGGQVTITTGGGSGHVIKDETISLTARTNLNFTGAGVVATDNAGTNSTDVTIATSDHNHTGVGDGGTLTDDTHDGYVQLAGSAAPATPATGFTRIYALTSSGVTRLVQKGDSGLELVFFRDSVQRVRNNSGGTITIGTPVYVTGTTGTTPTVTKAKADAQATAGVLGLCRSASVADNLFGTIQITGLIGGVGEGLDTSGFSAGDVLYLSATTAGVLTNTAPASPNWTIQIGVVIVSHASNGQIFLNIAPFHADVATSQITNALAPYERAICQGRLTTESGVAVSTSDRTAQGTIYFTPYLGDQVALFNGTVWKLYTFTERSLSLTITSGKNYDVFLYDNAGTLTLELSAAWTNDTTRADALTTQNGIFVKSGTTTRRWLGTIRASGANVTEDSIGGTTTQVGGKRFVWNLYNQVYRTLRVIETADFWAYGTDTWRMANGATAPANCVEFVIGAVSHPVNARIIGDVYLSVNGTKNAEVALGLSGTTPVGHWAPAFVTGVTAYANLTASYHGYPGIGYFYLAWLERGADGTACSFVGDDAGSAQCGIVAEVWG